jgi:hypothetical protein
LKRRQSIAGFSPPFTFAPEELDVTTDNSIHGIPNRWERYTIPLKILEKALE